MIFLVYLLSLVLTVHGGLFDFFQNQFQQQQERPADFEADRLNSGCSGYICPDSLVCVNDAKSCPCPYPSSQLRCLLPNGQHICISKPAGEVSGLYDDIQTNWKVDAKDDNIRDCGWVSRYYKGLI